MRARTKEQDSTEITRDEQESNKTRDEVIPSAAVVRHRTMTDPTLLLNHFTLPHLMNSKAKGIKYYQEIINYQSIAGQQRINLNSANS